MQQKQSQIDTSPKIAEYGVYWNRTKGGKTADANWCITEFYEFEQQAARRTTLKGYIGNDGTAKTFQYYGLNNIGGDTSDWYYFNAGDNEGTRDLGGTYNSNTWQRITFSIHQDKLDDCYVYVQQTGQIFFAGKNTIYYGYTNINDM